MSRTCACGSHTGGGQCDHCKAQGQRYARTALVPSSGPAPSVHAVPLGDATSSVRAAAFALHQPVGGPVLASGPASSPLDVSVRADMEARFGVDLGHVRIHADADAAAQANHESATAYTRGSDVTFAEGMYRPDTQAGRLVLAHELAHVVQQTRSAGPESPWGALEAEANAAAVGSVQVVGSAPPGSIQRLFGFFEEDEKPAQLLTDIEIDKRDKVLIPAVRDTRDAWIELVQRPDYGAIFRRDSYLQNALRDDQRFGQWLKTGALPGMRTAAPALQDFDEQRRRREQERRVIEDTVGTPAQGYRSEVAPLVVAPPPIVAESAPMEPKVSAEERARQAWRARTSPRQRYDAAQQGGPGIYIGPRERSLLEFEQGLKAVPGVRAGVPFAQVYWGEDIIGRPVDRGEAFKEGLVAFGEDLTMVLGPEDLMELGSARVEAKVGAGVAEDALTTTSELAPKLEQRIASSEARTEAALTREAKPITGSGLDVTDTASVAEPLEFEWPIETQSRLTGEAHPEWTTLSPTESTPLAKAEDAIPLEPTRIAAQEGPLAPFHDDPRTLLSMEEQQQLVQFDPAYNKHADWRSAYRFEPPPGGGSQSFGPRDYTWNGQGNLVQASTSDLTLGVRDPVMYANVPGIKSGEDYGHLLGVDFGHIDAQVGRHGGFRQAAGVNRPLGKQAALWYDAERAALDQALQMKRAGEPFKVVAQAEGYVSGVPARTRIFVEGGGGIAYDSGWIANPVKP